MTRHGWAGRAASALNCSVVRVNDETDSVLVIEGFSGAGGASLGIHRALPDATVIGIEHDRDACATRAAAGLLTIRADVAQMATDRLVGKATGAWFSPPCPQYSSAGKGSGVAMLHHLSEGITRILRGDDCRAEIRARILPDMATIVRAEWDKKGKVYTPAQLQREAKRRTDEACLVLEPARFARDLRPEWVACEQVPAVEPLWVAMGHGLEQLGYGWWAGTLDCASYGVAQNRVRAILMARRGVDRVHPPAPTHCDQRKGGSLFGLPKWISMAERLSWGMTERPAMTVAVGTGGGSDPAGVGGSGARRTLERERERNWVERQDPRGCP